MKKMTARTRNALFLLVGSLLDLIFFSLRKGHSFLSASSSLSRCFTIVCFCYIPFFSYSQSIDRQVIGMAGDISSTANISISWTVGEVAVQRGPLATPQGGSITEGFQQPHIELVSGQENSIQIKVFPNPVRDMLRVKVNGSILNTYRIDLLDNHGRTLRTWSKIPVGTQQFSMANYPAGTYFLRVHNDLTGEAMEAHQIIKIKS
ncbi:MAG: T9SS type A sorting domain-containing protein [Saprospiraceae bacterium]|nr:T9SS type A sorting domain-containing protein [Saprospiraceae bacterium]